MLGVQSLLFSFEWLHPQLFSYHPELSIWQQKLLIQAFVKKQFRVFSCSQFHLFLFIP
jgi:hypothetical protein